MVHEADSERGVGPEQPPAEDALHPHDAHWPGTDGAVGPFGKVAGQRVGRSGCHGLGFGSVSQRFSSVVVLY